MLIKEFANSPRFPLYRSPHHALPLGSAQLRQGDLTASEPRQPAPRANPAPAPATRSARCLTAPTSAAPVPLPPDPMNRPTAAALAAALACSACALTGYHR
jgi:hypothetical protein